MTRQTAEAFDHISLNPEHVTLDEIVRRTQGGVLDLDPQEAPHPAVDKRRSSSTSI